MENPRIEKFELKRELTDLEKAGVEVVEKLRAKNYEAYFAGGYARDLFLNIVPHDIDIATSAEPDKIEKIFPKNVPTGKVFGVIRVEMDDLWFEIATFRKDLPSEDARHPKGVKFTSAEEDAKRRDFTVNGLFYDPVSQEVIDFVGGIDDLKNKVLRFIGNPFLRIEEDHLRLIRAIRFKNKLSFRMLPEDWQAVHNNAEKIKTVSPERIAEELTKMLLHPSRAESIRDLEKAGILKVIAPELQDAVGVPQPPQFHSEGDVFAHTLLALKSLPENVEPKIAWAILLHDIGKPKVIKTPEKDKTARIKFYDHEKIGAEMAENVLKRLRFSNEFVKDVGWLVLNHMMDTYIPKMREAKRRQLFQDPRFPMLTEVFRADRLASLSPEGKPKMDDYNQSMDLWHEELARPAEEKKKKIISGDDIMKKFKLKPGKRIGQIIDEVNEAYLEGALKGVVKINKKGKEKIDKEKIFKFIKKNCKDLL
jgi:putative nucleotidyltransferase with HDIG domain